MNLSECLESSFGRRTCARLQATDYRLRVMAKCDRKYRLQVEGYRFQGLCYRLKMTSCCVLDIGYSLQAIRTHDVFRRHFATSLIIAVREDRVRLNY